MGSRVAEEHCNTETDEGTVAIQKKRSRRVSFAEITSVHVFDRDDDYETPPDSKPSSDEPELGQHNDELDFLDFKDSSQNEEEDGDNGDEFDDRRSFLRPMESPSPGSTIGSATSNDEENFFGPVSASFIRPGRLSDSAASDDNHDITMDSTAFSMHFRSLARSESGGDLKTPTGVHLSFEGKTPTQDTIPTDLGSSMLLTEAKKPISQSYLPINKVSGGSDSNDMSLIGENPRSYDYGRLSPALNALLAEGSKDLQTIPLSHNTSISKSPISTGNKSSPSKRHWGGPMKLNDDRAKGMSHVGTHDVPAEAVSVAAHNELGEANGGSKSSPIRQIIYNFSSNTHEAPASDPLINQPNWSPNKLAKGKLFGKSKDSVKDAFEMMSPYLELSSVNRGTLLNQDSKVLQLDMVARSEHGSPWTGSISPFAKEREIFMDSVSPSKHSWNATPSRKQPGSFVSDSTRKHGGSVSSIQKSISKLKMLETSPFSSLKAKIDSGLITSDIFKTPPFDTLLEKNHNDAQVKLVDASVDFSQENLLVAAQKSGENKSLIDMDGNDFETAKNIVDIIHPEESTGLVKGGRSQNPMSKGFLLRDQPIDVTPSAASRSQLNCSGQKTQQNPLLSETPSEGTLVTSGTDSLLAEITFNYIEDKKSTGTPNKFVPSPVQDVDSIKNVTSSRIVDNSEHMFMVRAQSSSPFIKPNHSKNFTGAETMDDRYTKLHGLQDESGTMGNSQTPQMDMDAPNSQSKIVGSNLQTGTDPARFSKVLSARGIKASSGGSDSPFACRSANETPLRKNLVECFSQSLSGKELCDVVESDNSHSFVMEDVLYPSSNLLTNRSESLSARKRTREEMIPRDQDYLDEAARIQRSPKVHKSWGFDSELLLEYPSKSKNETSTIGGDTKLKHWADVFSKFTGDTKQLLSPLIDKLNLPAIDVLEDTLVGIQRLKKYEMLCADIRSQKTFDHFSNSHHKRIGETSMLLQRIVHRHAKLQLSCLKREILLKKLQQVSSGIQESQKLKLHYLPLLSVPSSARNAQVNGSHLQSVSVDFRGTEEAALDRITAMKLVFEASDRKISNLIKSFQTCCKMKGEPNCAETIELVNDHLKKRACCRSLRLDLQLWEVDNLESWNCHHNIVLSYLGFIIQRFTINVGPVSSIVISNKLNNVKILEIFPNLDACTAFAFVFNGDTTQKYVGPRSLMQETQITGSLLGNLLDVVEEVQLAQLELQNLIQTSFNSSSVEQLDLQLCFINFHSGRKAMLILDMSCLNRAIY
ncbi:uncharacterized protein LOC132307513 isoform X2 [Cornus florida]|uniref:uncharacterized protein LOC132307513 isoform X2 n=1 Tax=Cornus florida TaxID=4283 RepID=UPI00289DB307|nr:uncharacterized protein LOC132307513 isoform X2 [Cornus florida]